MDNPEQQNIASTSNKKQILIVGYLAMALIVTLYLWLFGDESYKGFAYNLGQGLFWPAVIFPSLGKVIGTIVIVAMVLAFSLLS